MMRRIVLLLGLFIAFLSVSEVSAQIKLGVKGGINLPNVVIGDGLPSNESSYQIKNQVGFFIGPTVLITTPVKQLEVDASLLFDQRRVETKGQRMYGGPAPFPTTTTQQQLAIPVNVRYNLISGNGARLFVFAGPQLGINIGKKENEMDYGIFVFDQMSLSFNAGLGLLLSRHFQISANYNVICKKNAEIWNSRNMDYSTALYRSRFHAWQFSLGYYF